MKKVKLAALVLAAGFLLGGCGASSKGGFHPTENSIYVAADGSISTATIEAVSGDQYKEEELIAFVEQQVSAFNEEMGGDAKSRNEEGAEKLPVAVKSCTIKDGRAELILDYKDGETVAEFSEENGIAVASLAVSSGARGTSCAEKAGWKRSQRRRGSKIRRHNDSDRRCSHHSDRR